ncbi:MAG: non-ribosomal peptide synthetase, partial [Pseudomonadales bacterium]|nr:non-ribosomal peptide synthetase [Pseudomonadales bacterium]
EGVEGELYIGGLGLTLGYHHDAEKTNHAFCKVDLPDIGQTTLYRTGDIVISHACGNMEYRRRRDNQVKVRGYRIELGDIESALASLDNINEALVIVREDVPGDKRIVAYLVNEPGTLPTITEVRNKLKLLLPNYMIPQFIVNVPEFPKTPNGKIDRKALPVPYATNQQASANKPKPSGQHEELIADIWKKLLKNDNIYRNDNFFELGGHSLLSMEFINEIRGQTNVLFTPRDVILSDLSQLAKKLDESNKQNTTGSAAANNTPEKQKKRRFKSLLDRFK